MFKPALAPDVQVRVDKILIGLKPYEAELEKILIGLTPQDKSALTSKALRLLNSSGPITELKLKQALSEGQPGGVHHGQTNSIIAVLIGLLLPAVKPAAKTASNPGAAHAIPDGTSNTVMIFESLRRLEEMERLLPKFIAPGR